MHPIPTINFLILFSMTAIGIGETIYLIKKRRAAEKPICVIGADCNKVLTSEYSNIFGVHNDVLGLLFYLAVTLFGILLATGIRPAALWDELIELAIAGGAIISSAMIYLQWRVIKAWCFWCVLSAITVFVMAAVILGRDLI